ncbi:Z-ring formation inhibitor MciZ [Bacillus sp. 03113]|nr:Z-ring formation inhibitor MciZ [Bacillus sp. 03113]
MKIYVNQNGIILAGKAWEIRHQLKVYSQKHRFLKDWINTVNQNNKL